MKVETTRKADLFIVMDPINVLSEPVTAASDPVTAVSDPITQLSDPIDTSTLLNERHEG